jgi:ABC-type transport system involved in multi-copper enzyme maturation permease subunit
MDPNQSQFTVYFKTIFVLIRAELKRNRTVFLLPTLFLIGLKAYQFSHSAFSGLYGVWTLLITAAILAMTYGLQCFSHEADHKTLDFLLSRPLSPELIIAVKYGLSLIILLGWIIIFNHVGRPDFQHLALVKGMGPIWFLLMLLMVHALSCLSGLLAKGLERFFVITVGAGLLAGISYYLWLIPFNLLKANHYWFDILPVQLNLVKTIIPVYLALLSLATPLIGAAWSIRSRIPISKFTPAKWLLGIWLASYGAVLLASALFAPPLWPSETAFYGDWHDRSGILLSGPVEISHDDSLHKIKNDQIIACQITLAKFGKKNRPIYYGKNIIKPHFSPDGAQIVFTEARQLKILNLKTRQITLIGPGDLAAWSADSRQLVCVRQIGKQNLSKLSIYDLNTKKIRPLNRNLPISALAWDSAHDTLYYLGYKKEVASLNFRTGRTKSYPSTSKREQPLNYYGIIIPNLLITMKGDKAVWGQVCEDELRIFELDLKSGLIRLAENVVSSRMKNAAPVLINRNYQAFIWQRQDGSFVYQATRYAAKADPHEHGHPHDHGHQHKH